MDTEAMDTEPRTSRFSPRQRVMAAVLVLFFALVTIVSTVLSLGAYCLTTDGGNTRDLAETLRSFFL